MTRPNLISLILVTVFCAGLSHALPTDRALPITGQADQTRLDSASGENLLTGNVTIRQGTLTIRADRITLQRDTATGKILFMIAEGTPAVFVDTPREGEEEITVEGDRVHFAPDDNRIITEGNARILQAGNEVLGARIEYSTLTGVMTIDSERSVTNSDDGEQAEFIIQPGVLN